MKLPFAVVFLPQRRKEVQRAQKEPEGNPSGSQGTITKYPTIRSIEDVFRIEYHTAPRSGKPNECCFVHIVP